MFLDKINQVMRPLRRNDDGIALASVMGLMLVGILLTTLVASSIVSGLGQTTATRAGVQAQAAAEAGIAAAYAGLGTAGSCAAKAGIYESTTAPIYRATVWNGTAIGCPSGNSQIRIISTGRASAQGVAGNTSGNVVYLEATYAVGTSVASGAAVYIYNGGSVNAFSVAVATAGTTGNIQMPSGNFSCTTSSTINGDVIVAAGTIYLTNSCKVTGSLKASGQITMDSTASVLGDVVSSGGLVSMQTGNYVKGNVYANGSFTSTGTVDGNVEATGTAYLGSGARIKGNLTAGGTLTRIEGLVDGNVQAGGTGTTTFVPDSKRVGGSLAIGGDLDSWNYDYNKPTPGSTTNEKIAYTLINKGWVGGTVTYRATGLVAPVAKTAPTVPAWVDWTYTRSDWIAAGYAQEIVWPSGSCQIDNYNGTNPASSLYATVQAMKNATTPTVINALGCSTLNFSNSANLDLKFQTDIAFVSHGFTFGAVKMDSNDSTDRKAYFLVPDGQPTVAGNQCNNGAGSTSMDNATTVGSHLSAMLYTPCNISVNNASKWRGQLYSGTISVSSGDNVTYVPVGIPGTNLDGVTGGTTTTGALGALVSLRNRLNNGE